MKSSYALGSLAILLLGVPAFAGNASEAARYTEILKTSKKPSEKVTAAIEIGKLATIRKSYGKDALPYLFKACKDKDAKLKAAAAEALGRAYAEDDNKAVETLLDMLKWEKSDPVRVGVINGLVAQGVKAKEAIPTLRKIVKDEGKSRVAGVARNAVRTLSQAK